MKKYLYIAIAILIIGYLGVDRVWELIASRNVVPVETAVEVVTEALEVETKQEEDSADGINGLRGDIVEGFMNY